MLQLIQTRTQFMQHVLEISNEMKQWREETISERAHFC